MNITIALIQMEIAFRRPEINLARMEEYISVAVSRGAQLVVFPEDSVSGPLGAQMEFSVHAFAYLQHFQGLAVKYQVDLVPGTWITTDTVGAYNTAYYINKDGSIAGHYHKVNLWETERLHITPGNRVSVFPTAHGMVGLIICWDISFPLLFAEMAELGAEMVISPTYWSFTKPADEVGEVVNDEILLIDSLCTARAFENNIIFAYCNAAGVLQEEGYDAVLSGRSQVTHPTQMVVCKANGNKEEVLLATVLLEPRTPVL